MKVAAGRTKGKEGGRRKKEGRDEEAGSKYSGTPNTPRERPVSQIREHPSSQEWVIPLQTPQEALDLVQKAGAITKAEKRIHSKWQEGSGQWGRP